MHYKLCATLTKNVSSDAQNANLRRCHRFRKADCRQLAKNLCNWRRNKMT